MSFFPFLFLFLFFLLVTFQIGTEGVRDFTHGFWLHWPMGDPERFAAAING